MELKKFNRFKRFYLAIIIIAFLIYIYFAQKDGPFVFEEERYNMLIFALLAIFGAALTGMELSAIKRNESYIAMKSVYSGLTITAVFVLWRVIIGIF